MATQRLTVATFAGESAAAVAALFRSWRIGSDLAEVDQFCAALRENGHSLPIVYFCEWADRWLMGDLVPGPEAVEGRRYQVACLSPEQALAWASQCGNQFPEQQWLSGRLREAAAGWGGAERRAVIVVREVLDSSTTDEGVKASLSVVPQWIPSLEGPAEPGATASGDRTLTEGDVNKTHKKIEDRLKAALKAQIRGKE